MPSAGAWPITSAARHPGDSTDQRVAMPETVRVPAEDVLHIYRPIDAGQIRGLPHIAPAMVRLFLLDQYDDAELDRKKTAAMFAGFITKTAPEEPMMGEAEADLDGAAIASLEPGTLQVLLPGEDVKFSSPADVGGSYEAFQYRTLLAVSASLGLPYHLVTGDVRQANYSSLRAELVEFRRRVQQLQHGVIAHQLCRPSGRAGWRPRSWRAGWTCRSRRRAHGAVDPAALGLGRSAEGHPGAGAGDGGRHHLAAQGGRGHRLRRRGGRPRERGGCRARRGARPALPHQPRRDAGRAGHAVAAAGARCRTRQMTATTGPPKTPNRSKSMNSWYTIRARDSGAEVLIYDEIGAYGVSAKGFLAELGALPDDSAIDLRLNSPGGSVFDAVAIHNALSRHAGTVTVWIDGIAASAASYIAMAGDEIVMPENAFLMIHDPSGMVMGTAADMRDMAGTLDKIAGSMLRGYAARSGKPEDEIAALMAAETWFDAAEALEAGLATRMAEPVRIAASFDIARFRNAPPELVEAVESETSDDAPAEPHIVAAANDVAADPSPDTPGDDTVDPGAPTGADSTPQPAPHVPDRNMPPSTVAAANTAPDATAIRAEAIAHARAVIDLCRLAGQPQMAGRFLEEDASLDAVRAACWTRRPRPRRRSRPITRNPGAAPRPAPGATSSPAPSS